MSTKIDQKAYLQKYLGGSSGEKKKKKKKVVKGKGLKIIDDDIDLSKLRPLEGDELDVFGEGEDAPQIAGIIDERPEEIKKLEQFKTSSKWRVINQDDGFNSKIQIEEIKKDIVEQRKENEVVFGKMYSDSEDEKETAKESSQKQIKKPQNNSDSDISPPRKNNRGKSPEVQSQKSDRNYDSDLSPPRQHGKHDKKPKERRKPSRWGDEKESRGRSNSNSPRRSKKRRSESPKKQNSDSDASPPRKTNDSRKKRCDSDNSPPRRKKRRNSDESPKRKSNKQFRSQSFDSDLSPPRKRRSPERTEKYSKNKDNGRYSKSNKYNQSKTSSDSDLSPPRKKQYESRRKSVSPERRSRRSPEKSNKRKQDSDSDLSPPRKNNKYNKKDDRSRRNSDSPPPSNKKMASRTLDGKKAGLSDAAQLRHENESFRRREDEAFRNMTDDVSGRNAQVVSRKNKRETSEERRKLEEKAKRQKELDEKYKIWSKGIKQVEAQEARVAEFVHEASKPLARHRDDRDLDTALRQIDREGDPMLNYIRDKKRERGELPPEKPMYKGNFPPNRFNIRPGYRWDGVDRSNGYEKKYFETQSKKKAIQEEAYKWATEDL